MNMKIHKPYNKPIIALILASILLCSVAIGVASGFMSGQSGIGPKLADYVTLEGVAGNDYYDSRQYSYDVNQWALEYEAIPNYPALDPANNWFNAEKSLRIGMTEFGEFATPANTGIAYGADADEWFDTETWAAVPINPALYIQGWVFYMNYTRAGVIRCIESYAIYSDLSSEEAGRMTVSWDGRRVVTDSTWSPTIGAVDATGVKILYDSARLAVARATVWIYDEYYDEYIAKVTFTVILNKDTKYAIIYKDLKILIDPKVLDLINELAFSERYEIDLARVLNPSNQAFIHWFEDYNTTTYMHPLTGDEEFDILQAFNPERDYIYFAGYWPNTTEYAVYAPLVPDLNPASTTRATRVLDPGFEVADIPAPINEPNTPWVIAQWRYQAWNPTGLNYYPHMLQFLAKAAQREIRFVEVAGMTDYNVATAGTPGATAYNSPNNALNAKDINASDAINSVDTEVRFLLANVFNPQSLGNTLEKAGNEPFMWLGLGQSAATTDSAGGAAMADFGQWAQNEPLGLFDRNDTAFPWTAPVVDMKGTIPFGLDNGGNFVNYMETFSNVAKGTGADSTTYMRTGLNGFAFDFYDDVQGTYPQPIAGGFSVLPGYWYPSKNPLNERWSTTAGTSYAPASYYGSADNGIISLGGMKANGLTRYFNDFGFAISREGSSGSYAALANGGSVSGVAPTSNPNMATLDFFPISTWASSMDTFMYKDGYAVISVGRDINGTRGLSVYGWDGRDTYWAAAWASQYLSAEFDAWLPEGTVAVVLQISYSAADREPTRFNVVKALGTITEFGTNAFVDVYGFDIASGENAATWEASSMLMPLTDAANNYPTGEYYKEWWYEKLPTRSTAKVDFDP